MFIPHFVVVLIILIIACEAKVINSDKQRNKRKMIEDPPFIGDWHRSTKLGSGGFGVVWLWQNAKTKEKIAVKKCHALMGPNAAKQKERWEREVDYMTNKIRHVNIVRGIKVKPNTFLTDLEDCNPSGLPILLMEYCEGGDLRRQLNDSKNCSGLSESDVRNVLQSLKSAVEHLHSFSITHRDIKPENVVIQVVADGRRIYKLTDLGYAKPLDMKSIEASLVGTMEYIAPELITTEKYSCSVDYWSLGIIGFEVCTGARPFAPHLGLAQWMLRVRDKKPEHISLAEDSDGNIVYSEQMAAENHVSSAFKRLLEQWLRLALEWNPKQRGYQFEYPNGKTANFVEGNTLATSTVAPVQKLRFFSKLDEILATKILTIFVLPTHRTISMEVSVDTTMDALYAFVEEETGIAKEKCHIIVPLENLSNDIETLNDAHRKPIDYYFDGYFDQPMIYVNGLVDVDGAKYNADDPSSIVVDVPASVRDVLMNQEQKLRMHALRRFGRDTLFFVRQENDKYKTCLDGWFNYALQLNHEIELCRKDITKMTHLIYGLNGALELFGQTIVASESNMAQSSMLNAWKEQHKKFTQNAPMLIDACDKITVRYQSVHRRSRDAYQSDILDKRNTHDHFDIANTTRAFDALRVQMMNKTLVEKPHFELFQCAYKCLKRRDQLLHSKDFIELQRSLNAIHVELDGIKKTLSKATISAEKFKNEIFEANRKFHVAIWPVVEAPARIEQPTQEQPTHEQSVVNEPETEKKQNGQSLAIRIISARPDGEQSISLSPITQAYAREPIEFKIGTGTTNVTDEHGNRIYCFGEGNDTRMLIDDNEQLRISMAGLMHEIEEDIATTDNQRPSAHIQSNGFHS